MRKRVIIYSLGKVFDAKKAELNQKYEVIGYSDRNENMAQKLARGEIFIPINNLLEYDFHRIIICGGGIRAKCDIFYKYMDSLNWNDIVLLEELEKARISKEKFEKDLTQYGETNHHNSFKADRNFIYPIIDDIGENADSLDGHYFMQDICVAKKILVDAPEHHYDIGSRVDGFISHLLVFRKNVTLIDVRKFPYEIDGLEFIQADAINLDSIPDESIESLSCLHAAEHFGLGRYGDTVNAEAFFIAMRNFERVLCKEAKLYLSVPCGKEDAVYFNAHRMFYPRTVINAFEKMQLLKFEIIQNHQIKEIDINEDGILRQLDDYYCGIFTMQKIKN